MDSISPFQLFQVVEHESLLLCLFYHLFLFFLVVTRDMAVMGVDGLTAGMVGAVEVIDGGFGLQYS